MGNSQTEKLSITKILEIMKDTLIASKMVEKNKQYRRKILRYVKRAEIERRIASLTY